MGRAVGTAAVVSVGCCSPSVQGEKSAQTSSTIWREVDSCVGQGHPQSSGSAPQPRWGVPLPGRGRPSAGSGAHVQPGVLGDPPWASQAMQSSPERWMLGGEACESAGKCENGFNGDLDPDGRRAGGNAKRQVIRVQVSS